MEEKENGDGDDQISRCDSFLFGARDLRSGFEGIAARAHAPLL